MNLTTTTKRHNLKNKDLRSLKISKVNLKVPKTLKVLYFLICLLIFQFEFLILFPVGGWVDTFGHRIGSIAHKKTL